MTELAWQIILYKALPIVRVRTEPALRDTRLTRTDVIFGAGIKKYEDVLTHDRVNVWIANEQNGYCVP